MDKIRGLACLLVLLYHIYALTGILPFGNTFLSDVIKMGGSIGVTAFFVLSGYGIYYSLNRSENNGGIKFLGFIKKRFARIAPQYYFNIFVCIFFTYSAVYFAKAHFVNILSHLLFLHSWSMDWHGAINGVLWTMAVIFQFYLLAIPLYKLINKINNPFVCILISVVFTILMKWLMFNYLWVEDKDVFGSFATFIPGRQVVTSLDNFVCGMCLAKMNIKTPAPNKKIRVGIFIAALFGMIFLAKFGLAISSSIYFDYFWYSIVSIDLFFLLYGLSWTSADSDPLSRFLLFFGKYEYGIYLWHLPIIHNLLNYSEFIQQIINRQQGIIYVVIGICVISVGVIMDMLFEGFDIRKIFSGKASECKKQ